MITNMGSCGFVQQSTFLVFENFSKNMNNESYIVHAENEEITLHRREDVCEVS